MAKLSYDPEVVKQFIVVNHEFYTASEVARELGITYQAAKKCWEETGLREYTSTELLVILIKENIHLDLEKLADKLGYHTTYIKRVAIDNNLDIIIRPKGRPKLEEAPKVEKKIVIEPDIEPEPKKHFTPSEPTYSDKSLKEALEEIRKEFDLRITPERRAEIEENRKKFTTYTQIPTTFSEINDIKIKD